MVQLALGCVVAGIMALRFGPGPAGSVAAGAAVMALGTLVFGWRTTLRSPVVSAQRAFARLVLGSFMKWLVIAAGLVWALTADGLQPVYVLGGAGLACLAWFLCLPWLVR